MNISEALAAINDEKLGARLTRESRQFQEACRNRDERERYIAKELQPSIKAVKSYIRRRLKRAGLHPGFEGRGWTVDYLDGRAEFNLRARIYFGWQARTTMTLYVTLCGNTRDELDKILDAVEAAAKAIMPVVPAVAVEGEA